MGRRRTVEAAICPRHPDSRVVSVGVRQTKSGPRRDYRCTPIAGQAHKFSVALTADAHPDVFARWAPPPPCPEHPDSKVVRNGTYGKATPRPRQRYRCTPADGGKPHVFTPPLPRDHVHVGEEHCAHCEELRGIHRGESAVARRHTWPTRIVVRGLEMLARGDSYADVGRWARRVTGTTRTRRPAGTDNEDEAEAEETERPDDPGVDEPSAGDDPVYDVNEPSTGDPDADQTTSDAESAGEEAGSEGARRKKQTSAAAREAKNAWHIAADWVEAFAPVLYDSVDAELRAWALSERERLDEQHRNGEVLDDPQVVLVDDLPVYGRDLEGRGKSRRDAGFFVLAAAETHWREGEPHARMRLARAMAKSNTAAWLIVFDELGYDPDFIVADAGTGIAAAIAARFDPQRTKFIPSLWHLGQRIDLALADTKGSHTTTPKRRELIEPLARHLRLLGRDSDALASPEGWSQWWDELEDLLRTHQLPLDKVRTQRRNNEARMATVLPDIAHHPKLPLSTGGLETLMTKTIHPLLAMRRTAFANLERTNLLLDLAIAYHHGVFDDPTRVTQLLRDDAAAHGGWTVALRSIADPRPKNGSYSSLRDTTLLTSLAEQRGLL